MERTQSDGEEPDDSQAEAQHSEIILERTLAIFKKEAWKKEVPLVDILMKAGITVTNRRFIKLSSEQAMAFYHDRKDQDNYIKLVEELSCDIVLAMVLVKDNITEIWKDVVCYPVTENPYNHLAREFWNEFGSMNSESFHASDSKASAAKEIRFFFPDMVMEPILPTELARDYLNKNIIPTLVLGLTEVCRKKPQDPIVYLAEWLLRNNPNQPRTNEYCLNNEPPK
ncbi:hypothetical protein Aperf_G00000048365 [Anoplocephala perfoliata]